MEAEEFYLPYSTKNPEQPSFSSTPVREIIMRLKKSFTLYAYLPWSWHKASNGRVLNSPSLSDYLQQIGIQPVSVIYNYSSVWDGKPTNQVKITNGKKIFVIDETKIKAIALKALQNPERPISFDTEFGSRFHEKTVKPGILEIIKIFKKYNTRDPIGVYAVAP